MASLTILSQIQVSPSLPSQPPQPLSFLDKIWLHISHPVERLFFYNFPHPISHFLNNILPILTKSLSQTLLHFYPLAASIRDSNIVYTDNDTVPLTIAQFSGENFRTISGHRPRKLANLRLLVPKLANPTSVCAIQITVFANEGVCVGLTINHTACDGSSSMKFIRSWAAACRTADDIPSPIFDRSIIVDTHDTQQKIIDLVIQYKQLASGEGLKKQEKLPAFDPGLVHATFSLSKDEILRLKQSVGKKSLHLSTFVVTCGYVWRCLLKAKGYKEGGEKKECFMFAVDWRGRMRPEISGDYFGNCLGVCMAEMGAEELEGEKGIEKAAIEIGRSIDGLKGKDVGEGILEVAEKAMKVEIGKPLSVAGSPKLRVYEIDFGWGRPEKVDVMSIYETAAISLAEKREEEGGVEIGLVLGEEEMDRFVKCFSGDLQNV